MFSSTLKRSAATLGVVAGLLAAAVPASAMPIYVQYPSEVVSHADNALGTQIGALGIVKSFDSEKGSGFIVPDNGPPDVELHSSGLKSAGLTRVEAGQRVAFKVTQGPRGPQAEDVRLAGTQIGSEG
jgi:cold shock protein